MIIYDYNYNKKCELAFVVDETTTEHFGGISTLKFSLPYMQYDYLGSQVFDANGQPIENHNLDFVENENLIKYNGVFYVIKDILTVRNSDNEKMLNVTAQEKLIELSYKTVDIINYTKPLKSAIDIQTILLNILSQRNEVYKSKNVTSASTTVTLDSSASAANDYYNGYWLFVTYGTGSGQYRRVAAYDGTSKKLTIDALSTELSTDSEVIITDSTYTYGNIDSSITESFEFEFQGRSKLESLKSVADTFGGYLTYSTNYNSALGVFEDKVNIVKPNEYNGVEFRYKKNLQSVKKRIDSSQNIFTRCYVYGQDNITISDLSTKTRTDSGVTYNEFTNGNEFIENYQYFLAKGYTIDQCKQNFRNDFVLNLKDINDTDSLYSIGKEKLEKYALPKITYETSIIDLAQLTGYSYESFEKGDTIKVIDNELGLSINATVIEKKLSKNTPGKADITLSNYVENIGDIFQKLKQNSTEFTDLRKVFGKASTYIIADKKTSKNWRYADYFVDTDNDVYLNDILNPIISEMKTKNKSGRIILLEGDFYVNSLINFQNLDNTVIEGQGGDTKIIAATNNNITLSMIEFNNSSNSKVKSFNLDGANASGTGIRIIGASNNAVESVAIDNAYGCGIKMISTSSCTIIDSIVKNIREDSSGDSYGIYVSSSETLIMNTTVTNCLDYGIYEDNSSVDNKYTSCLINSNNNGMRLDGVGSVLNNTTVSENSIAIWAEGDLTNISNCTFAGNTSGLGAIYARNGLNARYSNNFFSENDIGIRIENMETCVVESNYFINNEDRGLTMLNTNKIKVQNNTFKDNNGTSSSQVFIAGNSNTFDGNTVRGSTSYSVSVSGNENLIINNDFTDGYTTGTVSGGTGNITGQNRS